MNNDKNGGDLVIGFILFFAIGIYFIIDDPFLLTILFPVALVMLFIYISGTNKRDTYFKSKKVLLGTTLGVGFFVIMLFYLLDSDFEYFGYEKTFYLSLSLIFLFVSAFLNWFAKMATPISFLGDDDRLVQETMYEDYEYKTLSETYSYRGVKFKDEDGKKVTSKTIDKASGIITPLELDITDLEMSALNSQDKLKFYYEKLIYDFYNNITKNNKISNQKLLALYGYNFTIKSKLRNLGQYKKALKSESFLYYKIFEFLEKDMKRPEINITLNFRNLYVDNLHCLELMLISSILMVRQYMNFPVGDLMKYVATKKEKNFMGCFSSLPADFANVNSTSISPSGIAYYYVFYKLHLNYFNSHTDKEVAERWIKFK